MDVLSRGFLSDGNKGHCSVIESINIAESDSIGIETNLDRASVHFNACLSIRFLAARVRYTLPSTTSLFLSFPSAIAEDGT